MTHVHTRRRSMEMHGMRLALEEAQAAAMADEVPVGAVLMRGSEVLARGRNRMRSLADPRRHAEIDCLDEANDRGIRGANAFDDCTLYVTLEPCAQCAGALVLARVPHVVFGAYDEKAGMAGTIHDLLNHPRLNHRCEVAGGVLADECAALLREFFAARRAAGAGGI